MSPAKLEANRLNAALSTGPVSGTGKAISSRNAISHGLTSRQPLLAHEDPQEFQEFVAQFIETYRPANRNDHALVVEFAELKWRLRRVPVVETQAWNCEMLELSANPENAKYSPGEIMAMAFVRLIQNKVITNLYAQEARLQGRANRIQKCLDALLLYQTSSPKPCPVPPPPQQQKPEPKPAEAPAAVQPICKNEPIRVTPQPGRNEPCRCGSGLKFKRCCLNRPQNTLAAAA
jgi:hypothetical protein